MPPIEGYQKRFENSNGSRWVHREENVMVYVSPRTPRKESWEAGVKPEKGFRQGFHITRRSTREEARKEAVRWMREHPSGGVLAGGE